MDVYSQGFLQLNKGLGKLAPSDHSSHNQSETSKIPSWSIQNEDVSLPTACLILPNLEHNINWMSNFTKLFEVELCPHAKTTMCPKIIEMQSKSGTWGMTTATVQQTVLVHHFGIKRILMANQLIGLRNMEIISEILAEDPTFEFFCIVDSVENVEVLWKYFEKKKKILNVLVEFGVSNGRTGVRNFLQMKEVLKTIQKTNGTVILRGIEFYEGILSDETQVRALCHQVILVICEIYPLFLPKVKEIIISGAGSQWFDIVTEELLSKKRIIKPYFQVTTIVLRPGCYVVHDAGIYALAQRRIQNKSSGLVQSLGILKPALKVIGYVQSIPETNLVIIGMGKRDVAVDSGFPIPSSLVRIRKTESVDIGSRTWVNCPPDWSVTKIMDQHMFMKIMGTDEDDLKVGDIISFDISHPCNTFSAWRHLLLVDETYTVLDVLPTYF